MWQSESTIGRLPGDSAASHWVADRAAAVDLLGRIAFAWSVAGRATKGGEGSPETARAR